VTRREDPAEAPTRRVERSPTSTSAAGPATSARPTSRATGLSVVASDAVVEKVADEIRGIASAAPLEASCRVGAVVLERCYGGDEAAWRSHGAKDLSLRRLADRLGSGSRYGAASLYRCVAIHLAMRRLGRAADRTNLTPSHVRLVLPLDASAQERLLLDAEAGAWSVRRLEAAVRARHSPSRRGRPRAPGFVHAVRQMERAAQGGALALDELNRAARLDRATLDDLYGRVLRLREGLELLQRAISPKRHAPHGNQRLDAR